MEKLQKTFKIRNFFCSLFSCQPVNLLSLIAKNFDIVSFVFWALQKDVHIHFNYVHECQ